MCNEEMPFVNQPFTKRQNINLSKFKGFADDISKVAKMANFVCDRVETWKKHCGKRRKCWLTAFSPFPTMFSKSLFLRVIKSQDCVVKSEKLLVVSPFHHNDFQDLKNWSLVEIMSYKILKWNIVRTVSVVTCTQQPLVLEPLL